MHEIKKQDGKVIIEFQEVELKEFTVTTLEFEKNFYEEIKKEIIRRQRAKTGNNV